MSCCPSSKLAINKRKQSYISNLYISTTLCVNLDINRLAYTLEIHCPQLIFSVGSKRGWHIQIYSHQIQIYSHQLHTRPHFIFHQILKEQDHLFQKLKVIGEYDFRVITTRSPKTINCSLRKQKKMLSRIRLDQIPNLTKCLVF